MCGIYTAKQPSCNILSMTNLYGLIFGSIYVAASSLTCLKDPPRKGERLTLSPTGTLAAITDSLGRVLLLDTQALVVVRLWKVSFLSRQSSFCSMYFLLFSHVMLNISIFRVTVMHTAFLWRCWLTKISLHQVPHLMWLQGVIIAYA